MNVVFTNNTKLLQYQHKILDMKLIVVDKVEQKNEDKLRFEAKARRKES